MDRLYDGAVDRFVTPADTLKGTRAGVHGLEKAWIPAFAGMTAILFLEELNSAIGR